MRICMLLHKPVVHDSRVRREAKALAAAGHDVTVVHLAPAAVPPEVSAEGYRVVSALPPRLGRRRLPFAAHRLAMMRRFVGAVRALRPDAVHAHDAAMLAPGYVGARLTGARLVYDSHELATGVPYRERAWAAFVWMLERVLVPRCDVVITVSGGVAERLESLYRLPVRPTVLRNLSDLPAPNGRGVLRADCGIPADAPLVLHQGAPAPGRGCEELVRALGAVPDAHLVFLGDPDGAFDHHVTQAGRLAGVTDRIHFHAAVAPDVLLSRTADADLGVSLLEDTCENHRLALPNKVFEYVAAEVPVLVRGLPELSELVAQERIGWVSSSFDGLEEALRFALGEARRPETRALVREAGERLSWERERQILLEAYARLG